MLKKLKHQFIATTLLVVIMMLVLIIGTINYFNFRTMVSNADDMLEHLAKHKGVKIKNTETGVEGELLVDGIFVAIGQIPENKPFENVTRLNSYGYIEAGEDCLPSGSPEGIFVAGDCRTKAIRQVTTATADGAVAALAACKFIDSLK